MNNVVPVEFHGATLYGLRHSGIVYIALRPIVEAMGLSWSDQLGRLRRDPILSKGVFKMSIPLRAGGPQEYVCLTLRRVAGWLFTIKTNMIKSPVIRAKVLMFQEECYDVLDQHFRGGESERAIDDEPEPEENLKDLSISLRLVSEARQFWGSKAAAELWLQRKLPKVTAMDEMINLFNWREPVQLPLSFPDRRSA
jgi:P22_AR N-terminal domain